MLDEYQYVAIVFELITSNVAVTLIASPVTEAAIAVSKSLSLATSLIVPL